MRTLCSRTTLALLTALLTPSILGCDADLTEQDEAAAEVRRDRSPRAESTLVVDARVPPDAAQTRFALFVGDIGEPPANLDAIEQNPEFAPMLHRRILLGGRDASGLANFREVDADTYTVCVAYGRLSGSQQVREAKIESAYAAVGGGAMTPEKLTAAAALLKADPTFVESKVAWSAAPVRCRVIEVTADPASRRVTID